ncbi:hypothetical protein E4U51_006293 [Claviceps purpurea]|nr:hypothetical protein E4U51_006293 [Claviceps purpurea]
MWAHRRITQGHHIKGPALVQHTNAIFAARGNFQPDKQASHRWAQRFIKRNAHIFKRTTTRSRDAKRKAGANRATIDSFYGGWSHFQREEVTLPENTWNFDETGFMISYLQSGMFVWTFHLVEKPESTDPHDLVSVTAIEAISTGKLFLPSSSFRESISQVKFVTNDLDDDIVITTSSTGYITDIIETLYREVAEGAFQYDETVFLANLQEIRSRTLKRSTILSAWRKCGLLP